MRLPYRYKAVILASLYVALASISVASVPNATSNGHLAIVRVGILQHGSSIPLIVAYHRDYFRQHGIDARLETVSPQDQMAAVLRRSVDAISPSSFPVILSSAQQNPGRLRCYMTGGESRTGDTIYGLIVDSQSRYRTLADLKGKTIASASKFTTINLRLVLREKFADVSDTTKIQELNDRGLLMQAVQRGEVDAAVVDQPALAEALGNPHLRVIETNFRARYLADPYWSGSGVLSADWTLRDPRTVRAFLAAIDDAIQWTSKHPGAARQLFVRHFELQGTLARSIGMYVYPGARFQPPKAFEQWLEAMLRQANMLQPGNIDSALFNLPR